MLGNLSLGMVSHIVSPDHFKFSTGVAVSTLDYKLFGKNIG